MTPQPEVEALRRIQAVESHIQAKLDALTKSKVDRVVDTAVRTLLIIMPALVAFIYAIDVRTQRHEVELPHKVSRTELQEALGALNTRIGVASAGPTWLREDLASISAKLDLMKDSITKLSERVVRIEAGNERRDGK